MDSARFSEIFLSVNPCVRVARVLECCESVCFEDFNLALTVHMCLGVFDALLQNSIAFHKVGILTRQ